MLFSCSVSNGLDGGGLKSFAVAKIGLGLNVQDNAKAHLGLGVLESGPIDFSFQSHFILWWAYLVQYHANLFFFLDNRKKTL